MRIQWNGHACFTIKLSNGFTVVTDPFDASVGYPCPTDRCDVVTVSHGHSDHNCTGTLRGDFLVLNKEGVYEADGIRISAIPSWHDDACGKKRGGNLIFKIEAGGCTVVHMGDIGHMPDEKQLAFIKGCTVLMLPVGGYYTIDSAQAAQIVRLTQPVCAVPMHYLTDAIRFPISDEKAFVRALGGAYVGHEADVSELKPVSVFSYLPSECRK